MVANLLARTILLVVLYFLLSNSRKNYASANPNERLYVPSEALNDPYPRIRLIMDPWAEQHKSAFGMDWSGGGGGGGSDHSSVRSSSSPTSSPPSSHGEQTPAGGMMMSASELAPAFGTRLKRPTNVATSSVGGSVFNSPAPSPPASPTSSSRAAAAASPTARSARLLSRKPAPSASPNSLSDREKVKIERVPTEEDRFLSAEQPSLAFPPTFATTGTSGRRGSIERNRRTSITPTTSETSTTLAPETTTLAVTNVPEDKCALPAEIECNPYERFRTFDGSCNNLGHPLWGRAYECFERIMEPHYADGQSTPRVALSGNELPPARILSNLLHNQRLAPANYTHMIMQFGQYLTHDILFTPLADNLVSQSFVSCCPTFTHPECYPIRIPKDDPWYAQFNKTCNTFLRSETCHKCPSRRREQITQMSAFIDASNIYGARANDSLLYRAPGGLLQVSYDRNNRPVLPRARELGIDQCSQQQARESCFQAGDARVNQHPALTSMNILFVRQHNRIASQLAVLNRHWDDERIYQETRRIVGAQMQLITYREYLPLVLGADLMNMFGLTLLESGYTAYEADMNPHMLNEFATGAFRFGHSMINGAFHKLASTGSMSKLDIKHNFFHPHEILAGNMDSILRGLIAQPAEQFDANLNDDVRNHLFQPPTRNYGADLASQNIQRGRDHALPGYVYHLHYCFNITVTRFEELDQFLPRETREWMQVIYENVQDIDLFTAGTSEYPLNGAIVGPTFACYIGMQFEKIKYGDRFWFEHANQAGSFNPAQLRSLRQTLLSKIICANADNIKFIQQYVMHFPSNTNGALHCDSLPDLDLTAWLDERR